MSEVGYISDQPGKPCKACASHGRLTWLDDNGSCRRCIGDELAQFAVDANASKAHKLTDAQLQTNIDTYRSSAEGTTNYTWRQACLKEYAGRHAGLGVGHIWTNVQCPAYRSYDPRECNCQGQS